MAHVLARSIPAEVEAAEGPDRQSCSRSISHPVRLRLLSARAAPLVLVEQSAQATAARAVMVE